MSIVTCNKTGIITTLDDSLKLTYNMHHPLSNIATVKEQWASFNPKHLKAAHKALLAGSLINSLVSLKLSDKLHDAVGESFGEIAREWHKKHVPSWSKSYAERTLGRMNANLIRWMGEEHINDITPQTLLAVLRRTESRGTLYTAHKLRQITSQIYRYAIAIGKATSNPADALIGSLPPCTGQVLMK